MFTTLHHRERRDTTTPSWPHTQNERVGLRGELGQVLTSTTITECKPMVGATD